MQSCWVGSAVGSSKNPSGIEVRRCIYCCRCFCDEWLHVSWCCAWGYTGQCNHGEWKTSTCKVCETESNSGQRVLKVILWQSCVVIVVKKASLSPNVRHLLCSLPDEEQESVTGLIFQSTARHGLACCTSKIQHSGLKNFPQWSFKNHGNKAVTGS